MRNSAAVLVVAVASLFAIPNVALADRIYSSMEKCNRKCHGVCFMEAEGAHCYWGALEKRKVKLEPRMTPRRDTDGKKPPRN